MKILLDLTQIPLEKVGVGIQVLNILKYISKNCIKGQYFAIIQNDDKILLNLCFPNVIVLPVNAKIFRHLFLRLLLEQIYIPFLILKYRVDVVHSFHYSFPLIKFWAKRIITIHDLTFFLYPELHIPIKRYYFCYFIKMATTSKNKLICVSKSTADDLKKIFPKCNSSIYIISPAKEASPVVEHFELISRKFNINKPYILYMGTLEPRKNIERLIDAYASIEQKINCDLYLVGKKGWYYNSIFEKVGKLNLEDRIIFTGFVTEEEKFSLLKNCLFFVYVSIYEGFGLPVLEALNEGKAVITSNISSMPEVAGNAAILVNPYNISQIAENMLKLTTDSKFRNSFSSKAIEQASKYTWENTAQETIKIYNNI
jgi:glycosyltransferase involved in cell wall biosynthesis